MVLFPFHVPIYIPRWLCNLIWDGLGAARIIPRREARSQSHEKPSVLVRLRIPLNFVTAPLIADLFLLAILAIGRQEVHDGTIGVNNISPINIMAFFLTLAYIAISIDASGIIRYLAFKVLQKGGGVGRRLFVFLYAFWVGLGSFIGNDPIILSGTAFLAYMTRVSSNIVHPRAWIHTQFAMANIASAILVSSNPTNLVLAGAFKIKFIVYTANMIVPVVVTVIVMFPFLLYIIFADTSLIPLSIKMHELSDKAKEREPVNPNIPYARGNVEEEEVNNEHGKLLSLEEIIHPFLDKGAAAFGAAIMTATLIAILAINASSNSGQDIPVFYVTLPAAFIMFSWDVVFGWKNRHKTREIAANGRRKVEDARAKEWQEVIRNSPEQLALDRTECDRPRSRDLLEEAADTGDLAKGRSSLNVADGSMSTELSQQDCHTPVSTSVRVEKEAFHELEPPAATVTPAGELTIEGSPAARSTTPTDGLDEEKQRPVQETEASQPPTLVSIAADTYRWLQETFPTVTVVVAHMPFPLVPFALAMFVLVQALVTKGWVPVFAYGWDHWVNKTGTVGAVGGMGFLSVILCNVSPPTPQITTAAIQVFLRSSPEQTSAQQSSSPA